jgi:hypothetical protein
MTRTTAAAAAFSLLAAGAAAAQDFSTADPMADPIADPVAAPMADPVAAQGFATPGAPAAQDFSLYRGSEASLAYRQVRDFPDSDRIDAFVLDTRHTIWIAPFLGSQVDLAAAWVDGGPTLGTAGLHVHILAEGGNRFGIFYLPTWESDDSGRLDMYGVEGMFQATPDLTVEARLGRFDGDDVAVEGPFIGAAGYFALNPQIAITASLEYSSLEFGATDVDTTDALIGVEYYLPGAPLRLSGGVGGLWYSGDIDSGSDLRLEFGATYLLFGEPAATGRTRTFGRQKVLGLF